jgi:K+-transporting ATPase ATPase C chain
MKEITIAIRLFVALSLITGLIYPLVITLIAQSAFKSQANGSLIEANGTTMGSKLIGQQFDIPKYLWGRPSSTSPGPYNAASSSGSNLGPTNPDLIKNIQTQLKNLKSADPSNNLAVPTELVTSSASGLDPHISIASAEYQLNRIAKLRGIEKAKLIELLNQTKVERTFGLLGEPTVNVLEFNLALDSQQQQH